MGKKYVTVGECLRQVLWGQILTAVYLVAAQVGARLQIVPISILASLVSVVGIVITIMGLAGAGAARTGYKAALHHAVMELAIYVAVAFAPASARVALLLLGAIAGAGMVYLVCAATRELLLEQGEISLSIWANPVWKCYTGGMVFAALVNVLLFYIPWFSGVKAVVLLVMTVVQLAAVFLYLFFLHKSQQHLREQ